MDLQPKKPFEFDKKENGQTGNKNPSDNSEKSRLELVTNSDVSNAVEDQPPHEEIELENEDSQVNEVDNESDTYTTSSNDHETNTNDLESTKSEGKKLKSFRQRGKSKAAKKAVKSGDTENKNNKSKIGKYIALTIAMAGLAAGGYLLYPMLTKSNVFDLVNFDGKGAPNESLEVKNEVSMMKQRLSDAEASLGQAQRQIGELMNYANTLEQMQQAVNKLEQQIAQNEALWDSESLKRKAQIDEILQRLSEQKSGLSDFSKEESIRMAKQLQQLKDEQNAQTQKMHQDIVELRELYEKIHAEKTKAGLTKTKLPETKAVSSLRNSLEQEVKSLGHLKLDGVVELGTMSVAQVSDGVSGGIQVVKGDFLGNYEVMDVTAEGIHLKTASGERYFLVKQG